MKLKLSQPFFQIVICKLCMIICALVVVSGCSTSPKKDANKDLFQQALILQKTVQPAALRNTETHELVWQFVPTETELDSEKINALFNLLISTQNLQSHQLVIELGPDWLASHLRGQLIRAFVPRGVLVQQTYKANMKAHTAKLYLVMKEEV